MFYQIKSYAKFLLNSSNQHGVHSPFVYDLLTNCLYDKTSYPEFSLLNKIRKQLYADESLIDVNDFGEGSKVFTSDKRKVSKIARQVGISQKRQRLLFRIIKYFNSENIIELGTSLGIATSSMALANPSAEIITIEGCPNISEKAKNMFDVYDLKNIQLKNETFEDYFRNNTTESYDLVYIDGNHSKEKTLEYFDILLNKVYNESVLIFDDIYWSPAMTQAWEKIIAHPKVKVSIDTYQWGLVFFRKEQEKEHFRIRL